MTPGVSNSGVTSRHGARRDPDLLPARRRAALVLPGLLVVLLLFVYPLLTLVGSSFSDGGALSLVHYARIVNTPVYTHVLLKTFWISAAVTLFCFLLGYPLGFAIAHSRGVVRALLLTAVLMPFWTNLLVRAYGWIVTLHPSGLVNSLLMGAGLVDEPLALVYNTTGTLIGMTQIMLPYMALPVAAIMEKMDVNLTQAARSLGASPVRTFLYVYFPLTLPGVFAGALLVFVLCLGFFVIPALLGGRRDILIAQLINFNLTTTLNWGFAAALCTILLVTTMGIYLVANRWFRFGMLWGDER